MAGFPKSDKFQHVVIEALYRDGNGVKYCAITGLSRSLQPFTEAKLYTFTALHNFEHADYSKLQLATCHL